MNNPTHYGHIMTDPKPIVIKTESGEQNAISFYFKTTIFYDRGEETVLCFTTNYISPEKKQGLIKGGPVFVRGSFVGTGLGCMVMKAENIDCLYHIRRPAPSQIPDIPDEPEE